MLVKHLFIIVQCPKSPSVHSQQQKKRRNCISSQKIFHQVICYRLPKTKRMKIKAATW